MKYLKTYNESSNGSDIEQYCEDILLELKDIGYNIVVRVFPLKNSPNKINISITNKNEFQDYDISDAIYSLDEYLKTQGFYRSNKSQYASGPENIAIFVIQREIPYYECFLIYEQLIK
jgi:hypothetical protein